MVPFGFIKGSFKWSILDTSGKMSRLLKGSITYFSLNAGPKAKNNGRTLISASGSYPWSPEISEKIEIYFNHLKFGEKVGSDTIQLESKNNFTCLICYFLTRGFSLVFSFVISETIGKKSQNAKVNCEIRTMKHILEKGEKYLETYQYRVCPLKCIFNFWIIIKLRFDCQ